MSNIEKAQQIKTEKYLSKLIKVDENIMTIKQMLIKYINDGYKLVVKQIHDERAERKAQNEIDIFKKGWYPLGNENHPITKKYNKLVKQVNDGIFKDEYRLYDSNNTYLILNKTEYNFVLNYIQNIIERGI